MSAIGGLQVDLEMIADPVVDTPPTSRTPLPQHTTFRAVTESPHSVAGADGTTVDPEGPSLVVPVAALPSPMPAGYTLRIPKVFPLRKDHSIPPAAAEIA